MITYNGCNYCAREMHIPSYGTVLISNSTLRNLLIDDDCKYRTEQAKWIDETIFFYVEDNEFNWDTKSLTKLILTNLQ